MAIIVVDAIVVVIDTVVQRCARRLLVGITRHRVAAQTFRLDIVVIGDRCQWGHLQNFVQQCKILKLNELIKLKTLAQQV
jgi:hypothetical protein